jgi:hypothetical protein
LIVKEQLDDPARTIPKEFEIEAVRLPPADPKFQELLRGRGQLYAHLTGSAFRAAFARHFTIQTELLLLTGASSSISCESRLVEISEGW